MSGTKRIGLVVSTLSVGLASSLWGRFADEAEGKGNMVFVLPHSFSEKGEFSLPLRLDADGFICWSSNISAYLEEDPIRAFLESISDKPYVTIGVKSPGHPSVSFEAHDGIVFLVRHLAEVHGARRIVFLRGPLWHRSAEERFSGYRDALSFLSIPYDPELVSSPFPWEDGRSAISEILGRGLVPGRDFDAVAAASDRLMLGASELLAEKGYRIPEDILAAGFNDGYESLLLPVPATTVRIPAEEMARISVKLLSEMLDGTGHSDDIVIPSFPVIRSSCSCYDSFGGEEKAAASIHDIPEYLSWLFSELQISPGRREEAASFVHDAAVSSDWDAIGNAFSSYVYSYFLRGGELRLAYEAVRWFRKFIRNDEEFSLFAESALIRLPMLQERAFRRRDFEKRKRDEAFVSFQDAADEAVSWDGFGDVLMDYMPLFSVDAAWCVMDVGGESFLACGFSGGRKIQMQMFPSSLILPDGEPGRSGVYIIGEFPGGYIVLRTSLRDGVFLDHLISSCIASISRISESDSPEFFTESDKAVVIGTDPASMISSAFPDIPVIALNGAEPLFMARDISRVRIIFISGQGGARIAMRIREERRFSDIPLVVLSHGDSSYAARQMMDIPNSLSAEDFLFREELFISRIRSLMSGSAPFMNSQAGRPVRKAIEYIAVNYPRDITRWSMASALNISEDYLERLFKREMGMTLWDYLLVFRIGMAEDLLSELDVTVAEAAERTGFRDRSYFCRVFRRFRGYSPRAAKGRH